MQKNFLAFAMLAAITTPVMADGFYGALDLGQTIAQDACRVVGLPAGTVVQGCNDRATLSRIAGGYQFDPKWGAEISYGNYGNAKLGTVVVPGYMPLTAGSWDLRGMQASGTGTFPIDEAFSLIGKIGIARTTVKIAYSVGSLSATSTKLAFGIGAQYKFNQNVSVRVQYENLGTVGEVSTTGTTKVSLVSGGVVWKF